MGFIGVHNFNKYIKYNINFIILFDKEFMYNVLHLFAINFLIVSIVVFHVNRSYSAMRSDLRSWGQIWQENEDAASCVYTSFVIKLGHASGTVVAS